MAGAVLGPLAGRAGRPFRAPEDRAGLMPASEEIEDLPKALSKRFGRGRIARAGFEPGPVAEAPDAKEGGPKT